MKTKICHTCQKDDNVMYRIQFSGSNQWVFCCKSCTQHHQSDINYRYGGTWKGNRH